MTELCEELRTIYLKDELRASLKAMQVAHLKDRTRHPRAQAILTPKGRFPSASLAAEVFGITRQHAARLAKSGQKGWSVLAKPPRRFKFGPLFGPKPDLG